ncbi:MULTISPECIES: YqjF family protein [Niastella]|uniref:DUF2071 domain-containing protein n=1 Tax=Niastella soli TaxID=2821487 RepID=A0ABS3YV47_9BACT|nr:DUF2071 domain-containing protein [Niastella soli]MBO9201772.1 DUF2071 domain-containing protein [Niastella soli]
MKQRKFLSAQWLRLIMANYVVDPHILKPFLPAKTELDTWNGRTYVSLVGFLFHDTRVMRIPVPFHTSFPEVNLRFYVRYKENDQYKRGVVFVKEIVPKPAITFVANSLFKERYVTLPMKTFMELTAEEQHIGYQWKFNNHWNKLEVKTGLKKFPLQAGSEEEFITEHFWGYSTLNEHMTGEYQVSHPSWDVFPVKQYNIDCDFGKLYGPSFSVLKEQAPVSVFLAEGSEINVYSKRVV